MATNFDIDLNNNQDNFDIDLNDQVESFVVEFGEITWVTNNDFNKLKNRPSYAGETMTGDTNIPVVPTATSQLTNDANFQNANDLSNAISAHNQSSSAHQDIRQAITDEANIRSNADNGLQSQIDAITSASDVVDIVGTYAELQAYDTQHLKDNDVIKVLQDETHNDAMTYWRWSTHTNTWTYIGAEGPYYTKSETNTLLDEKLDVDEVPDGFFDGPATITPAQGTSVELEKGLKLKSVELLGDTTQQTYRGKNLFGIGSLRSTTNGSSSISNGVITLIPTGTGNPIVRLNLIEPLPAGTYTLNSSTYLSTTTQLRNSTDSTTIYNFSSNYQNVTFTTTDEAPMIRFNFANPGNTNPIYIDLNTLQIEAGSTATTYEPYVGGVPAPNPDYPQTVNVVTGNQTIGITGKNLASLATSATKTVGGLNFATDAGYISINGTATSTENFYFDSFRTNNGSAVFSALVSGYTDKTSANSAIVLQSSTDNSTWSSAATIWLTSSEAKSQAVTLDSSKYYRIRLLVTNATVFTNATIKPQLEYGSTTSTYEPYQGATYTVNLGSTELCKIGNYQDYIYKSGDDWYVHKAIGKVVLDGTEPTWSRLVISGLTRYFTVDDPDALIITNTSVVSPIISNNFTSQTPSDIYTASVPYGISLNTNTAKFRIRNEDFSEIADFTNWLSTHNTTVYYALATPTDTKITNSVLIGQLDAVLDAVLYSPTTYLVNSGNLPAILKLEAFTGNLNSLLEIASEPDNKVFVGTDGNVAGKSGFVPAPKTTDDDKFLKSDGTWATVSGGSSVNVVQTVGNSQTDVMSQRAVTSMVFKDPATRYQTLISGGSSDISGIGSVALGYGAQAYGQQAIAIASGIADASRAISIGGHANNSQGAKAQGSIALGYGATTTQVGEMNIGSSDTSYGYATSNYRLISGVYDGQNAHDAVTVGQINDTIDAINTALSTNIPHIGAST